MKILAPITSNRHPEKQRLRAITLAITKYPA
jgi:hypothetical protein